jgi:hypothetical protein
MYLIQLKVKAYKIERKKVILLPFGDFFFPFLFARCFVVPLLLIFNFVLAHRFEDTESSET